MKRRENKKKEGRGYQRLKNKQVVEGIKFQPSDREKDKIGMVT